MNPAVFILAPNSLHCFRTRRDYRGRVAYLGTIGQPVLTLADAVIVTNEQLAILADTPEVLDNLNARGLFLSCAVDETTN